MMMFITYEIHLSEKYILFMMRELFGFVKQMKEVGTSA